MGSRTGEAGGDASEVAHEVVIDRTLLVSQTPVTRAAWAVVLGQEPPGTDTARLPVERISWYEGLSFCNALSLLLGLTPCYGIAEDNVVEWDRRCDGFRLPTEAEWEFLCRAGSASVYHSGDREGDLAAAGWYEANSSDGPMPVGQLQPNAWGLFDMHGNVWEWCWDWSGPYVVEDQVNPEGPSIGQARVLRGGSWRRSMHHCRSATRYDSTPENRGRSLGLRVLRTLHPTPGLGSEGHG
jgi:formylglycine-generating enzyme required for sulfatase activity